MRKFSVGQFVPREELSLHQWLGATLVGALILLAYWRSRIHRRRDVPDILYLAAAFAVVAGLLCKATLEANCFSDRNVTTRSRQTESVRALTLSPRNLPTVLAREAASVRGMFSYVLRALAKRPLAYVYLIEARADEAAPGEEVVLDSGAAPTAALLRPFYPGVLIGAGGFCCPRASAPTFSVR